MKRRTLPAALAALLITLSVASCSRSLGWGVVLWPPEGSALPYGEAAAVLFQSNITKTYAVSVPGSDAREELELWRVELHSSRRAAERRSAEYRSLAGVFGLVTRDGLILRAAATNTAEQVYRMRHGEEVKLLAKTQGALVETGGERLPGDWYLALASDGTRGYVYSNQLMLWDARSEPRPSLDSRPALAAGQEADLFNKTWRPDYFLSMVDQGRVDLASYQQRFGIFTDPIRRQIRIERPEFSKFYSYTAIEAQPDGSFVMPPSGLRFGFTQGGELIITPPTADLRPEDRRIAEETGQPRSFLFVTEREDPRQVIAAEERRRLAALGAIVADGELFESDSGSSLIIGRTGRFTWIGYEELVPNPVPEGAGTSGNVAVDLFLGPELASIWQGGFSLRFDGAPRAAVSFAYRYTPFSLELAYVAPERIRNGVVSAPEGLDASVSFSRYR